MAPLGIKRFRLGSWVLAVLVLTTSFAFPAQADEEPDVAGSVQRLLDERVDAIRSGDRPAFLKTIDPQTTPEFRQAQVNAFDGLSGPSVVNVSLKARINESGDLAEGLGLAERYGADSAFLPETRLSYRFEGYDEVPAVDSLWFTYVQRGGQWFVASDADAELIGLRSDRELWDFGPVEVTKSEHFIVLSSGVDGGPQVSQRAQTISATAERAFDTFDAQWAQPWSRRIPLVVPASSEQTATLLRSELQVENFVAFVAYTPLRDDGWRISAPRIYAQDVNLSVRSEAGQVSDFVHELTHAATAELSGPNVPTWMQEGLAEWVRSGRPNVEPPVGAGYKLPIGTDFSQGDGASIRLAYAKSLSATAYLARTYGSDAPLRLFTAVGEKRTAPGSPSFVVDAAFRDLFGTGLSEFESAWHSQ